MFFWPCVAVIIVAATKITAAIETIVVFDCMTVMYNTCTIIYKNLYMFILAIYKKVLY